MPIERHFARRMAPLAILAGLVVAGVPPVTYHLVAWEKLERQAEIYAGHIGHGIREAVFSQPRLWRYNAAKVLQATVSHRAQKDIAAIDITDACGNPVLTSGATGIGAGAAPGPIGSVPVEALGRIAAMVSVRIDPGAHAMAVVSIGAVSGPLGLMIGLLLFFFPTRVVRQQSRRLSVANRELQTAKDELTDINQALSDRIEAAVQRLRQLSKRVVQIQEDERRRIARDLHDGIGQAITGLQLELELARERPGEAADRLAKAITTCAHTLAELRRVVQEIRPPEVDADNLPVTLRALAELFEQRTGIHTSFRSAGAGTCPDEVAICLLRLLQESLTNIQRHAGASEAGIHLQLDPTRIIMEIHDDGCGFDPTETSGGIGLQGMQERCEFLGGRADIDSTPGRGTRLSFELPREGRES